MRVVELEASSEAWHAWRGAHIGGSDANLIAAYFLDVDYPYGEWAGAALFKLWAEKIDGLEGRTKKRRRALNFNDPRAHGLRTETVARTWYEEQTGTPAPPFMIEHVRIPYLSASLDGWTGDRAVEIKCPVEPHTHLQAKEGQVPESYYAQCQHNLFVSGAERLDFVSYHRGEGVIVPVTLDADFLASLRLAEDCFWQWVESREFGALPPAGEARVDEMTTTEQQAWGELIDAFWATQQELRATQRKERELRRQILRNLSRARLTGCGTKISVAVQRAAVIPSYTRDEYLRLEIKRA